MPFAAAVGDWRYARVSHSSQEERVELRHELGDRLGVGPAEPIQGDLDRADVGQLLLEVERLPVDLKQRFQQLAAQGFIDRRRVRLAVLRADALDAGQGHQRLDSLAVVGFGQRLLRPGIRRLVFDGGAGGPAGGAVL
jgi:hypothetical protein